MLRQTGQTDQYETMQTWEPVNIATTSFKWQLIALQYETIGADGNKEWFVYNKRHRLDGPAIEHSDGNKWWYVDGNPVEEEDYPQAVLLYKCKQVLES